MKAATWRHGQLQSFTLVSNILSPKILYVPGFTWLNVNAQPFALELVKRGREKTIGHRLDRTQPRPSPTRSGRWRCSRRWLWCRRACPVRSRRGWAAPRTRCPSWCARRGRCRRSSATSPVGPASSSWTTPAAPAPRFPSSALCCFAPPEVKQHF